MAGFKCPPGHTARKAVVANLAIQKATSTLVERLKRGVYGPLDKPMSQGTFECIHTEFNRFLETGEEEAIKEVCRIPASYK